MSDTPVTHWTVETVQALIPVLEIDGAHQAASALTWALERIDTLSRLDREAATHVETIICMRTHFTGDSPYVGWKGLGLALREHLDRIEAERDAANARADEVLGLLQATAPLGEASFKLPLDWITKRDATIRALREAGK
jgi:hypothetical protein